MLFPLLCNCSKGSATDYMLVQQNTMGDVYCQRLRNRVGELDTTEKSAGELLCRYIYIHTYFSRDTRKCVHADRSSDLPPVHSR